MKQNGCHFPGKIFKLIFIDRNILIFINWNFIYPPVSNKKNTPAQVMVDAGKSLLEPMMASVADAYMPYWASMS